uniref:CS domain-containing protein n=1 Tax=Zooxanthella nutricula TaxID=1333877 RepID=A0A7S2JWF7_9DINO|mmetsp:Transcript_37598/g.113576  ORF Transcript_37598/g.113576 Transcript_37598/m.113576 type:complete len:789 (+) Transcript_37598:3-2369(+)
MGYWDGRVYKLREFRCTPASGSAKTVDFTQTFGRIALRHVLRGEAAGLDSKELSVELSRSQLKVCAAGRKDLAEQFAALNGDFHADIRRELSWWTLEKEDRGDFVFTISLAKREHKAWTSIWKVGMNRQKKQLFGWDQKLAGAGKKAEDILVRVRPGKPPVPDKDPFIMNRESLCAAYEDGQDEATAVLRIHFDRAALEKACETVSLSDLLAVDVMDRFLKVFIRGDERSPILMGELAGQCIPEMTHWEIMKALAPPDAYEPGEGEDEQQPPPEQARGPPQYLSCLQVTITKAQGSRRRWPKILTENPGALERGAAPVSLEDVQARAIRNASPDRTGWTAADYAKENKGKADACFKKNDWRDASVYYTKAIGHTPDDEKLYSNRSACYVKLKKFDKALADARTCTSLQPKWPKAYFRQGQALRGLRKFDEAVAAFQEGRFRDPANPDWTKEIEKTEDERDNWDAHLREQRRLRREADMTTELNEATTVAEREAMVIVAEQALKAGKSRKEAGELAMKGAELAKQKVHEMASKKKAMMVEDDTEANEPAPYRIVTEDGGVHPRGFCPTERGTYYLGMVVMNHNRPPQNQPWVELRHPGKLRWTQGCAMVRLKVTLPESVKSAADIEVAVTAGGLRINTVGDSDPVVVGEFDRKVDPQGENFAWFLIPDETPPMLELILDKDPAEVYQTYSYGSLLWPRLFSDDVLLGEGLFEADLTDLPPHLLEKWRRENARADERSLNDRKRRQRLTEEEILEETSRNWNDEFARCGMPQRFDTNEEKMVQSMARSGH